MKNYIINGVIALCVSLGAILLVPEILPGAKTIKIEHMNSTPVQGAVYTVNDNDELVPLDFVEVSNKVKDAVVHIKSTQTSSRLLRGPQKKQQMPDPFRDFFGDDFYNQFFRSPPGTQPMQPEVRVGSGSGVIINEDGYIITNNHVIADAGDIEVTLHDRRTYKAKVIGVDPSTDLALIQIKENGLDPLPLVNSDDVQVGEWVLAVGNPFNLNSTVTAGIVSAKSRNINILKDRYAIESFIQTDAAINPGNSGGALVNLQGGLIGINTAIASPTGAYAGYGFAVPANLVSKVVEDLLNYGVVQRGFLGVTIRGVDGNLAREKDLEITHGVYIDSVADNSAAGIAGVKSGDIVLQVDGLEVNTAPELQEIIAQHRPGDQVKLSILRGEENLDIDVELKNRDGENKFLAKNASEVFGILGAEFEDLDEKLAKKLDVEGGVLVRKLYPGRLSRDTEMSEGFVITHVDGKAVKNTKDLEKILSGKEGGVLLEGVYEDIPGKYYYAFGME